MSMYNARRETTPGIPKTLNDWNDAIRDHMERYGQIKDTNFLENILDEKLLLFVVRPLVKLLKDAEEIHCDSTYKVLPRVPKSYQFFTVMSIAYDHVCIE